MREPLPIVGQHSCLLSAEDLELRVAEWRALMTRANVRSREPGSVIIVLPPDTDQELTRLIQAEAECCSFLRFEVTRNADAIDVELHYPPDFEPQVSSLIG